MFALQKEASESLLQAGVFMTSIPTGAVGTVAQVGGRMPCWGTYPGTTASPHAHHRHALLVAEMLRS